MPFGDERGALGFGVRHGLVGGVGQFAHDGAPRAAGFGPDGAAQPVGGAAGYAGAAVEALQEPEPYGLFEVAGLDTGGRGLRLGLGGEQRGEGTDEFGGGGGVFGGCHAAHDTSWPPAGCRAALKPPVRASPEAAR
ncbi:hypothetical protein AMK26_28985 [Streptomyces sp. CB03234]|nr:hypothetical protein AMK26_28985 [Streptomyces sp. CB03234]